MKYGLAALFALALAGPAHADPFQGTAVFHATVDGKSMDFRFAQLGSRMRQEIAGPSGMMAVVIYDSDKGEMTTLMPQQKKFMTMKLSDLPAEAMTPGSGHDAQGADSVAVTPTGEHAKVAGIACDGYQFKTPSGTVDICSAKGLGMFGGMGSGRPGGPGSGLPFMSSKNPAMARFAKEGFFPLRMKVQGADGKVMTWEATSVDRTRPDASLFTTPADYTPIDTHNMMPPH